MSLFDTFDPQSEELIKANLQRSYREESFPEVVIGAFKEETFCILEQRALSPEGQKNSCPMETAVCFARKLQRDI